MRRPAPGHGLLSSCPMAEAERLQPVRGSKLNRMAALQRMGELSLPLTKLNRRLTHDHRSNVPRANAYRSTARGSPYRPRPARLAGGRKKSDRRGMRTMAPEATRDGGEERLLDSTCAPASRRS